MTNTLIRSLLVTLCLVTGMPLIGADTPPGLTPTATPNVAAELQAARKRYAFTWVGLNEAQAAALAASQSGSFRVIWRDGQDLPVTRDLRPGRASARISGGVVAAVSIDPAFQIIEGTTDYRMVTCLGRPLTEVQAFCAQHQISLRIASVDGQGQAMTADYNPQRVNAIVAGGIVVAFTNG